MQVILTATAVPDKFGVGLNGFKGSIPPLPPPTELSAEWFDSVQQELVNVIIGQGIALDGLVFDQMKQAIDDYAFADPSITGSLSILNGATLYMAGGSQFFADDTSLFIVNTLAEFSKDMLIGDSAGDALIVTSTSTFQSAVFFNDDIDLGSSAADTLTVNATATFNSDVTLGNADTDTVTFVAKVTSDLEIGIAETTDLTVNSDTTFTQGFFVGLPNVQATAGKVGYDGINLIIGNGASINDIKGVRSDYVVSDTTGAANDDLTGASVTMTITPNDWIFAKVEAKQLRTDNASTCNIGIAATNGVDTVTILNNGDADQAYLSLPPSTAILQTVRNAIIVRWKPTNDFAVPANNNWTIYARHGVSAGTLTSSNVYLQIWR
jgi:hypothetical protein